MPDVPVELVVAAFTDENGASRALKQLKEAKKEKLIAIKDAAVIRRDVDNKVHIHETGDMSGGRGAAIGGIVGAAIGIVAPPAVLVAGAAGAAIGGLAAKLRDSGFSDARLREVGAGLKPGTSALIAVIEHSWVRRIEQELAEQGAQMVTEEIKADIAEQLEAGHGVSYSAITDGDSVSVERNVEMSDQVQESATNTPDEDTRGSHPL
jgi:uncharacterized membrane protein